MAAPGVPITTTAITTATEAVSNATKGGIKSIYEILKPKSMMEILIFLLLMTAIYIITALLFYNQVKLKINTSSQCYLAKKAITANGVYTATAKNQKGNPLYTVGYDMPSKSYAVNCACPAGAVTNTFPNVDVYNLETQQTMRIQNQVCGCDKQYYSPGYDNIYFSGYPGVTRYMNTASLVSNPSEIQTKAVTSFFQSALNPKQYYNTY